MTRNRKARGRLARPSHTRKAPGCSARSCARATQADKERRATQWRRHTRTNTQSTHRFDAHGGVAKTASNRLACWHGHGVGLTLLVPGVGAASPWPAQAPPVQAQIRAGVHWCVAWAHVLVRVAQRGQMLHHVGLSRHQPKIWYGQRVIQPRSCRASPTRFGTWPTQEPGQAKPTASRRHTHHTGHGRGWMFTNSNTPTQQHTNRCQHKTRDNGRTDKRTNDTWCHATTLRMPTD